MASPCRLVRVSRPPATASGRSGTGSWMWTRPISLTHWLYPRRQHSTAAAGSVRLCPWSDVPLYSSRPRSFFLRSCTKAPIGVKPNAPRRTPAPAAAGGASDSSDLRSLMTSKSCDGLRIISTTHADRGKPRVRTDNSNSKRAGVLLYSIFAKTLGEPHARGGASCRSASTVGTVVIPKGSAAAEAVR